MLGPISNDPAESVSSVNGVFLNGLGDRYEFLPLNANRTIGNTRQAALNPINATYFFRQWAQWTFDHVRKRPALAHHAISAGWGMEKSFVLLNTARLLGAKTVGHIHSGGFLDFWRSLPAWRRRAAEKNFSRLDGLILLSESWRDKIAAELKLPREKLFVVNNPIDAQFEKEALSMPVNRPSRTVFSLGTMGRPKGVIEMIEAVAMLPRHLDFKIVIAGPEREPGIRNDVQQLIDKHALAGRVELKSSVWGAEKIELYRGAAILLLPSYYENFPVVVLEAAAAGVAIVTTPVGAVPEFFENDVSAIFVEPKNAKQIAVALEKLLTQPSERERLAQAARALFCTRLTRAKIMDSLDSVYRQILAR